MSFTETQSKAATLSGDSLLVSAGAGAGKTTVLTERVRLILTDEQKGVSADRLLILTFTKAAAAEMRERITETMRLELKKDPHNEYIKKQISRLPCAQICTIDSACLNIIRQNFSALSLDPQFTPIDTDREELMKAEELDDFMEELYDIADTDPKTQAVIEYFTKGRDDRSLKTAIDSGSDFLLNQPYPKKYIQKACDASITDPFDIIPDLQDILVLKLTDIINEYDRLALRTVIDSHAEFYRNECEYMELTLKWVKAGDFDKAVESAFLVCFKTHKKPEELDKEEWQFFKDKREELKKWFLKERSEFLYAPSSRVIQDRLAALPIIRRYLELCDELNERLWNKRRKLRYMSFNDMEKLTLSLLVKDLDGATVVKTELAKELSETIDEMIIDEYQDCNRLQELIFKALSKDGKNMFMVGDVKQSIYRFRNAQPDLFVKKQNDSIYPEGDVLTSPSKLDLLENFRSHPKILDFVNAVFYPLMTKDRCGIDYKNGHALVSGGLYGESTDGGVEIDLVLTNDAPDAASRALLEARHVARRIKSIVGSELIYDIKSKSTRTVKLSDIAVLMKAPKTNGALYEQALKEEGIEYINNNPSEKYLETDEVMDLLAYLQVIDNPYNEIPLVTLMYSDYFSFTASELGAIRAFDKDAAFFDAVTEYAKQDAKTKAFVDTVDRLRSISFTTDVYGIINAIFSSSGVLMRLASQDGGDTACENLQLILDFAREFESARYKGLFSFINFVNKLIDKDSAIPPAKLRKNGECVSILSIHGSKGLEYPVVFVVNTASIGKQDSFGDILLSVQGVGDTIKDQKNHREFKSVFYNTLKTLERREKYNEQMRLLYVALTRAKSRLYITASLDAVSAEKLILKADMQKDIITYKDIYHSPHLFKWMVYALINTKSATPFRVMAGLLPTDGKDGLFLVNVVNGTELDAQKTEDTAIYTPVFVDKEHVKRMVSRQYAYTPDTLVPAKLSVSEIKGMARDTDGKELIHKELTLKKPRFMQGGVTGADRGNATHRFLQFCKFSNITDSDSFDKELARLTEDRFISKNDAELVDKDKILRFLENETMRHLETNGESRKEERFVFTMPACEILDTDSREHITVQGVIDCFYIIEGKAVIVDYKTDYVKDEKTLIDRYKTQLDMYEKALYQLEKIQTLHKYIYSFCLEKFIAL